MGLSDSLRSFFWKDEYGKPSATLTGQVVRSNGEKAIADFLTHRGITYRYETAARRPGDASKVAQPDFYLPQFNLYLEFWGLIDVPNTKLREKYRSEMRWKMKQYYDNKIGFVSVYPSYLKDLDYHLTREFKKHGLDMPEPTANTPRPVPVSQLPDMKRRLKVVNVVATVIILAALVVGFGSGSYLVLHSSPQPVSPSITVTNQQMFFTDDCGPGGTNSTGLEFSATLANSGGAGYASLGFNVNGEQATTNVYHVAANLDLPIDNKFTLPVCFGSTAPTYDIVLLTERPG